MGNVSTDCLSCKIEPETYLTHVKANASHKFDSPQQKESERNS